MSSILAVSVVVITIGSGGLLACAHSGTPSASEPLPKAEGASGRSLQDEGTGSLSVVDGDDLHGRPAARLEDLLEGQVAGVQVMQMPGGGISIRIRGSGSITGDNEPLYVVDGMPVTVAPGRGLDWLNPGDIKRIEILKDASTTSMYGVRGANGVVVITTRRGKRPGDSR